MFKKSLLALALAGVAVSGAANAAATITTGASVTVALEGHQDADLGDNTLNDTDLTTGSVNVVAGTSYITNDLIYVTISGAEFDVTDTPAIVVTTVGAGTADFIDFLDANTMRFRIATADWAAADDIDITSFTIDSTGATAATEITFSASALSVNPAIGTYDASTTAATGFDFAAQLTTTTTVLNGEVSTGAGRAEFTTGANQDVLTIANVDGGGVDALTYDEVVHVVTGDFSWLMDYDLDANGGDADGTLEAAEIAVAVTDTGCTGGVVTFNSTLTELTMTDTGALAASCAIELNNVGNAAGGSAITSPQSFTITSTYADGTDSYTVASASAGAFTLDGSSTDIAFLPFGSAYAQSITVTNDGSVVGAITVTITSGGMSYSQELTAVASAKSVTDISAEVAAFAAESGVTGNAQVNVTTNSPGIVVKGVYYHKATQDRVLTQ